MTTLDRLFKKGILDRRACDRAFLYVPRFTREELVKHLAAGVLGRLLATASSRLAARPILSTLVETVGGADALLLDELEALIRAERLKGPGAGRGARGIFPAVLLGGSAAAGLLLGQWHGFLVGVHGVTESIVRLLQ